MPLTSPLHACLWLLGSYIVLCWLLQSFTTNYSWVDRLWSIVPPVYLWVFALWGPTIHLRLLLMALVASAWGVRLTFNFARKGGYHPKAEDYRWEHVRAWLSKHDPTHPLGREIFSFFFIALYQHLLIGSFCIPAAYLVWSMPGGNALTPLDVVAAVGFLGFLSLETLTDAQQWAFHKQKRGLTPEQRAQAGGDVARGFCTSGVFRWSRHMNFFSEMGLWWSFAIFPVAAGVPWLNYSLGGPFLLTLLFQGSTWITELLSVQKYPEYPRYQKAVSRLLPWPGKSLD